jgi:hypothetical protein
MSKPITETLATHIISVYNAMEEVSIEVDDIRIYEGALSRLIRELGISMTFYSPIFRALYDGGYCALGDKGGREKGSTVVLLRRPQKDELLALTASEGYAIVSLVNRMETLEANTGGMYIVGALQEMERRLVKLEKEASHGKTKK